MTGHALLPVDDRLQDIIHPQPSLGTALERIAAVESDGILDLLDAPR